MPAKSGSTAESNSLSPPTKRAKKAKREPVTEREPTPRRGVPATGGRIKIISWNVDGLRAAGRLSDLKALVDAEDPDLVCLQETKLNAPWDEEWQSALPNYDAYWACGTTKKG